MTSLPYDGSWSKHVKRKHLKYLLKHVVSKKILIEVYQGVDGKTIISDRVQEEITNVLSQEEANGILFRYLLKPKRLSRFKTFIEVLRRTSAAHEVHEEVVKRLEEDAYLQDVFKQLVYEEEETDSSCSLEENETRNGKLRLL